jgi:hypothetical protein
LGFWIGAPDAPEGTTLKKHRGPDARPIMDAILLDIKNSASNHVLCSLGIAFIIK